MPFTAPQLTQFFTSGVQMALTASQRASLAAQGLTSVDDFADFGKDELDQAIKNMRTHIPGVSAVPAVPAVRGNNGSAAVAAIPAVPAILPIVMPAKSTHRLLVAAIAYHYYTETSRAVTHTNMHYSNVLKSFYIEWKALVSMSEETSTAIPCITKSNPPLKWTDTFKDWSLNTFGVRDTPLAYIIRDDIDALPETRPAGDTTTLTDPLAAGNAHGTSGSIIDDLVARLTHTHPLYKTDNAKVYSALETATRSTTYSSTVKGFSRSRDGRGAWLAIVTTHAGKDKWEQLQTDNTKWLINTKWSGTNSSLEKFCNLHRTKFVNLQEAANHVDFQLPTSHTRVGYLIQNIENDDADLRAAIANVRQDVKSSRSNFENAVAVLLPVDPFVKSRKGKRQFQTKPGGNISSASQNSTSNDGVGKTGVVFHFYDGSDYAKLSADQKKELHQWRESPRGKAYSTAERKKRKSHSGRSGSGSSNTAAIKSAVDSAIARERKRQKRSSDEIQEVAEMIASASVSVSNSAAPSVGTMSAVTAAHTHAAAKLLEHKKNSIKKRMKTAHSANAQDE